MTLCIYNTLTGKKDIFKPLQPGHVKLYVCGITSYDYCHIGHARSALAFDMLVRYLRYRGYSVSYVRNFTDVDDKIINRAVEQKISWNELAHRFIVEFYNDMDALGIDRPDIEPKATEHIPEMVALIDELIKKGKAYSSGKDVFFAVEQFPEYGKLSRRSLDDMQAGARISINTDKRNPMDFVLWKGSKPGEPSWESPWGPGRPGWHIECSAMSRKYLGETFDIHGGGKDLIFPHHENEIAQSEAANCCPFVTTWIHHGFVTIRDEKMSKSLNNFLTVRELRKHYHPEVLRYLVFSTHYRSPLDFSETAMQDAAVALERLYRCVANIENLQSLASAPTLPAIATDKDQETLVSMEERFLQAMDNDLNTAQALAIFFEAVKVLNRISKDMPVPASASDLQLLQSSCKTMKKLAAIMGLLVSDPAIFFQEHRKKMLTGSTLSSETIELLITERNQCRALKNWRRSDAIRDQLLAEGIVLKDEADGTSWTVRKTLIAGASS